jgi:hypothetical protein
MINFRAHARVLLTNPANRKAVIMGSKVGAFVGATTFIISFNPVLSVLTTALSAAIYTAGLRVGDKISAKLLSRPKDTRGNHSGPPKAEP